MTEGSRVWTQGNLKEHVLSRGETTAEPQLTVAYGTVCPAE